MRHFPHIGGACLATLILASARGAAQTAVDPVMAEHTHAVAGSAATNAGEEALLSLARSSSARFRDRKAAIAAGYRLVGTDFPSMGEHWISPRLVIEGQFDVARPAILTYVTVGTTTLLTGVVYAVPLSEGENPPPAFGLDAMWHEHNGTVDEESMHPIHDGSASHDKGTRLAILHAWTGVANPAGIFAAENWALPFVRLGLSVPESFPTGAARALSLLAGGARYYLDVTRGDEGSSSAIAAALSECAATASVIVNQARLESRALGSDDLKRLDDAWNAALNRIGKVSSSETVKKLNGGVLPR
jgi:hypothetical protein